LLVFEMDVEIFTNVDLCPFGSRTAK